MFELQRSEVVLYTEPAFDAAAAAQSIEGGWEDWRRPMCGSHGEHTGRDGGTGEQAAPKRLTHHIPAFRGSTRRSHARRYQHRIFSPIT